MSIINPHRENPKQALMEIQKLSSLALKFRKAIENSQTDKYFKNDCNFRDFPYGCCGDASDLLAEFLMSEYHIPTLYVCGYYYYTDLTALPQSHAWLKRKDIIIDITGDQFHDRSEFFNYNSPVYVGKLDAMHELFVVKQRDIRIAGLTARNNDYRMKMLYKTILSHIVEG